MWPRLLAGTRAPKDVTGVGGLRKNPGMTTLCVVSPGALGADGDRLQVSPKAVEGLRAYAERWPGDVVFVARRSTQPTSTIGFEWPSRHDLPCDAIVADDVDAVMTGLGRDVVRLMPADPENKHLVGRAGTVLVVDYPVWVRWEFLRVGSSLGPVGKARIGLGLARRAATVRAMIRQAAGVQCNGPNSFEAYAGLSRSPHQFFDTRVTAAERLIAARDGAKEPSDCLRLGFSGRWMQQKGPDTAVRVANDLRAQGMNVSLTMFGGGPMETTLRAAAGDAVEFAGPLAFHEEWVPRVTSAIDLMLLPHPQSDSASTYLESMSCGVPVMAYANGYWKNFHRSHGAGWTVPEGDVAAMTASVARLASDREGLVEARALGLRWAEHHTVEQEFDARVSHMRDAAGV